MSTESCDKVYILKNKDKEIIQKQNANCQLILLSVV